MKTTMQCIIFTVLMYIPVGDCSAAQESAADTFIPLKASQVKVGGEIGRRIDITIRNNLLAFDIDKAFLQPFRDKNVQGGSTLQRYIGLGKLIDAVVHFAAYTQDKKIVALKEHIVEETIKTQLPDGYIGIFAPAQRVKMPWDLHEMVYVIYGLVSDYREFGNPSSLQAAEKLGRYIMKKRPIGLVRSDVTKLNLERAFIALFVETGRQEYLDYCAKGIKGKGLRNWNEPIRGHAYTYMNLCIAQLDLYRIERDEKLLTQSRNVIEYITGNDGLLISGTVSRAEGWHNDQDGSGHVGETCSTAYLIRLLSHLLRLEGNSLYGDIMERSIYNSLFAAQSPDGRHLRYFCPLQGKREYFETRWKAGNKFLTRFSEDTYCCPNNFRRIIARLPSMIYYRVGDGLAINLYTPSSANAKLEEDLSLTVRQETDYPNSGQVVIHVNPSRPSEFPLLLRIPRWCEGAEVTVNGTVLQKAVPGGSFFTIRRQFKAEDLIQLNMPMKWRFVKGRKKQDGRVALMRGPMLFCLNPARNGARLQNEMKTITIEPSLPIGPVKDERIRPDGLACYVRAWDVPSPPAGPADMRLMLTEFADPGGEMVCFNSSCPAVDDELIRKKTNEQK